MGNKYYTEQALAGHSKRVARWAKAHPDRNRAHQAVHVAIQTGELEWWHCQVCGSLDSEAHHNDYSKPLEVRWLCPLHHNEVHHRMEVQGVK